MIQRQLKLKLTVRQEATIESWLPILTSVWNWAVRKIELDARDHVYYTQQGFQNMLAGHGAKVGIPSHVLQGMLTQAYTAWERCFTKRSRKPHLKGRRNRLNSIPFPDPIKTLTHDHISVPGLGSLRYHTQTLPAAKIKCARLVRRASGWYLCLFIDAEPNAIPRIADGRVGIDLGYLTLATLSTGEKIAHPRELQRSIANLARAQRGGGTRQAARLQERIANQRKDRNHKLSRRLVSENVLIAVSKDHLAGLSRSGFGKSVSAAAHGQLRRMLDYKSRLGGSSYVEVPAKNSTRICSDCGCLTGPTGRAGLSVRQWVCSACGSTHDRDENAAINTLTAAVGATVERAA